MKREKEQARKKGGGIKGREGEMTQLSEEDREGDFEERESGEKERRREGGTALEEKSRDASL